ncbi:AAA family ATPase [Clostridium sp.]|uniref:AAA family ATPase n=1 Tax=Clostridium sp. TaxID=1506 RepID=UPI002FC6000C
MGEGLMIIVSGASATGKTTLSKNLGERFNLPVINKDEIKEVLFDTIGIKDTEWAMKLGVASFELTFFFVEKLLQTGKSFIVEGNFDNRYSTKSFIDIKSRYNYKTLQIYCHAKEEVLYERYISRDNSGNRHPGHIRLISGFEDYKNTINSKPFKLDIEGSTNIDIDTTKFENMNLQEIYDEVENNIKFIK